MNKLVKVLILLVILNVVESARILAVFHLPSYSHNVAPNALIEELAGRGHEITVLTSITRKVPIKNIKDINLPGFEKIFDDEKMNLFDLENTNPIVSELFLQAMIHNATEELLKHENVRKLLNSNEQFDLVLIEDFLGHALKGFAHHFNAPCVMISSIGLSRMNDAQVGNPYNPAYIPEMGFPYTKHMNFFQRLYSSFIYVYGELVQHFYVLPCHNELLQKYFPKAPHINDIYYNVSLLLVNAHVSIQQAVPYVPNVIDIGGIHVKSPKKLPKDIQEYLDNAKDGVIFFSMGSNLKSADLPTDKRKAILGAFSKLKQKVLWKFEDEDLPRKPSNVKIGKWLPQTDILAHPNVKLFITHGGLMSQIETIHRGVPVLGIPIFGDQKSNMANEVLNGLGISMTYSDINEETLLANIQEVLTNAKYGQNAKKYAKIMADQPITPLERGAFWIEYVLRHNGAPHLRSAALDLTWYQYLLLDVILFVAGVVLTTVILFYIIIKKLFCKKQSRNRSKSKKD